MLIIFFTVSNGLKMPFVFFQDNVARLDSELPIVSHKDFHILETTEFIDRAMNFPLRDAHFHGDLMSAVRATVVLDAPYEDIHSAQTDVQGI